MARLLGNELTIVAGQLDDGTPTPRGFALGKAGDTIEFFKDDGLVRCKAEGEYGEALTSTFIGEVGTWRGEEAIIGWVVLGRLGKRHDHKLVVVDEGRAVRGSPPKERVATFILEPVEEAENEALTLRILNHEGVWHGDD